MPALAPAYDTPQPRFTLTVNTGRQFNLADYLEAFLADQDGSAQTVETYRRNVMRLFEYLSSNGIQAPTRADIIAYRDHLSETHKPSTVQAYLTAARIFLVWCNDNGVYANKIANVRGPKTDRAPKKDYLTAAQVNDIIRQIDRSTLQGKRDYAMIALMLACGLRCVEVERANIGDMRPYGEQTVLYIQGKGHCEKSQIQDVPPQAEKAIRAYLTARGEKDAAAPLFAGAGNKNKGGRLTTRAISGTVKKIFKQAGYDSDRLTAHSLRHTAVTQALIAGETLDRVQQFARHANIQTTMIYNHSLERAKNQCGRHVMNAYNFD